MKIINYLFNYIDLKIPIQNDYFFYSNTTYLYFKEIPNFDDFRNFKIIYAPNEKINLFILLKTLLTFKFNNLKKNYIENYITFVKPKYIINAVDNNYFFYELYFFLKKKNITSIVIQNGMRTILGDIFSEFENKKNLNLGCDFILTMNKEIGNLFLNYLNAKNLSLGSIKNNNIKIKETKIKKSLVFISQFNEEIIQKGFNDFFQNKYFSGEQFYQAEKIVIKFLINFCKKNNFNFSIISTGGDIEKEYNFFSSIISKNYKFEILKKIDNMSSYKYTDKAEYTAFIESTLGYESLARKNKIMGFSIRGNFLGMNKGHSFAWPCEEISEGPSWTSKNDINEFARIEKFALSSTQKDWDEIYSRYSDKIMLYDDNNKLIKDLFKKTGIKNFI